jgi:hypothetical protein
VIVLDKIGKSAASSDGCGDTDTRNSKNDKVDVTRKAVRIALSRPGRGRDSGSDSIEKVSLNGGDLQCFLVHALLSRLRW